MPLGQFVIEHQEWRAARRDRLVRPPYGPAIWIGLWELPEGATRVGADSSLPIVFPRSSATDFVGTFYRSRQDLEFEPAPGAIVHSAENSIVTARMTIQSDLGDSATDLAVGSIRFRVHGERGTDRRWVRAWDMQHAARDTFALPDEYMPDTTWRLAARFDAYEEPRTFQVPDILQGIQEFRATGEVVFHVNERPYRLIAFANPTSTTLFIMFHDSTAMTTTYQGGRYVRTPLPDSTGWTVLDFNRAYNPPCVFSVYSTCALPPRENRLALAVTAGEKRAR